MIKLTLVMLVFSLLSSAVTFISFKSNKRKKAEVEKLKREKESLIRETEREKHAIEAMEEVFRETGEKKKKLHSGSNVERFNASLDLMHDLAGDGGDPSPDTPA